MGATPPVAPRSSVRRLACGTVCTVLEYGTIEKIQLYHFHLLLDEGGRAHVGGCVGWVGKRQTILSGQNLTLQYRNVR